jgi:anti-sigma regulatory factor (Ser/Thr protein kinase)
MHNSHCEKINCPVIVRRNRIDNSLQVETSSQTFNLYFAFAAGGWRRDAHIMQGVPLTPNANHETQIPAWKLSVSSEGESVPLDPRGLPVSDSDEMPAIIARQEFECPGDLASVAASREQIMQFVSQHCPDEAEQIDILVALQEALANAALHGCGDNAAKTIRCAVEVSPPDITISVRDPGAGFDFALADPDNFAATAKSNGRGICLMRSLMTEVTFAHGGSELIMRKRFEKCR